MQQGGFKFEITKTLSHTKPKTGETQTPSGSPGS